MQGVLMRSAAAALFAVVSPALAVDGTILIDQAKAFAGNVTPGDSPGFPVTITQPGSYRLASNLRPPAATTAIQITASNVTLDLNGFGLIGASSGAVAGIQYVGPLPAKNITIRNGVIADFMFPLDFGGIFDGGTDTIVNGAINMSLQDLTLNPAASTIVSTGFGSGARILNVSARGVSVALMCPSAVSNSVAFDFVELGAPLQCARAAVATGLR